MIIQILIYCAIGGLTGLLSGLLGIGGGVISIPFLVLVFHHYGLSPEHFMHLAIGTSLAAMVFTTFSSMWSHYRKKGIVKKITFSMFPGIVLGAIAGPLITRELSSQFLQIFFGVFELLIALKLLLSIRERKAKKRTLPALPMMSLFGLLISTLSTMLGVGGGLLSVPLLNHYSVPMTKAIGTSSSLSFTIAFVGALAFMILAGRTAPLPDSIGYIYLPAFFSMGIVAFLLAPIGSNLAHILPTRLLKLIFGIALICAGLAMILT